MASDSKRGLLLHNAPSLTIEAKWNTPVRVKWINDLKDANGNFLPHLLPVDPTLHWANPPGGITGRDTRPTFTSTPGPYTGPVPIVTHVHGAVGVGRRERRLRRGLVSACCQQYPDWLCHRRHLVQFLHQQGRNGALGSHGVRALPFSSIRTRIAPRPSGITTTSWA